MDDNVWMTIEHNDADLIYTRGGRVAHIKMYGHLWTICNRYPDIGDEDSFLGTGTQEEREKARSLPLCRKCEQRMRVLPYWKNKR